MIVGKKLKLKAQHIMVKHLYSVDLVLKRKEQPRHTETKQRSEHPRRVVEINRLAGINEIGWQTLEILLEHGINCGLS